MVKFCTGVMLSLTLTGRLWGHGETMNDNTGDQEIGECLHELTLVRNAGIFGSKSVLKLNTLSLVGAYTNNIEEFVDTFYKGWSVKAFASDTIRVQL